MRIEKNCKIFRLPYQETEKNYEETEKKTVHAMCNAVWVCCVQSRPETKEKDGVGTG